MTDFSNTPENQRPGPPPAQPGAQTPPPGYTAGPPPAYGQGQQPPPGGPRTPYAGPQPGPRPPYGPPPPYGAPGWGPPQGPPPPQFRPPWQAPPPRSAKRSALPLIIGIAVLIFMGVAALTAFVGGGSRGGGGALLPFGEKIAILDVNGVLGEGPGYGADTARLRELVERWTDDKSIKGMVIRINSPGGAVSATQDLYQAIENFKKGPDGNGNRPVYASMGDIAASGGYYIAMSADEVYANPGTLTGSVGVIINFWGYEGLTEKIGLEPRTIKSGQFKDIGSGGRPMTPEEKALLEEMILSVYDQFYDVVLKSRGDELRSFIAKQSGVNPSDVTDAEIETYLDGFTDGRIFSGQQAYDAGLVDHLGTLHDAEMALKKSLGLHEDTRAVTTPKPQAGLFGMFNQKAHALANMAPGSVSMEYRFSL